MIATPPTAANARGLETAQTVMSILEWLREVDISRCELSRQRVRIRNQEISVPASCRLPPVVWEWIYTDTLEQDHGATPAHDAKEEIVAKSLKGDLKPQGGRDRTKVLPPRPAQ